VDQLRDYADSRLIQGCIYCDTGKEETRDHVPSRVFLDPPFPTNLPVVPACYTCNNGFAQDEEYLACLIECVLAGSTDPDCVQRPRVADILQKKMALRSRLEAAKSITDSRAFFTVEEARVENVVRKLARGHAAFELSLALRRQPTSLTWLPLSIMTDEERKSFETAHVTPLFGEVGSRGMQRLLVTQLKIKSATGRTSTVNVLINDWVDVQEGRYRYLAIDDTGGVKIKIVIAEYLACDVYWAD
jgi:hypothetical protein